MNTEKKKYVKPEMLFIDLTTGQVDGSEERVTELKQKYVELKRQYSEYSFCKSECISLTDKK